MITGSSGIDCIAVTFTIITINAITVALAASISLIHQDYVFTILEISVRSID